MGDITSPWDACHVNRDLSWEREAWDAALAKTINEAVAREMAKAHAHYQAFFNENSTAAMQPALMLCCSNVPLSVNPFQFNLEFGTTHRVAL